MSMKMGIGYVMENTVVEFEENVRIAVPRPTQALMACSSVAASGGTSSLRKKVARSSASWDISQERHPWSVRSLRSKTVDSMTKTPERIAQVVEA